MVNELDKNGLPPYSNRVAVNTTECGLRALVDWVSITLKSVASPHDVADLLGIDFSRFREAPFSRLGYLNKLDFGDISILYNGKEDMGIHINMTGQGCRQFEEYSSLSWSIFFALLLNFDVSFTRLDLAIDDFDNYLSIKTIKRKLDDKLVRSKFRDTREIKKRKISDGKIKGETVYFGSESGRIQVRFYNKLLEREGKGFQVQNGVDHWVRVEIQMRDERAHKAAFLIANEYEEVGELTKGILSNYICFLVKAKNDTNKARWPMARFWKKFLDDTAKIGLSQEAPDKTIQRSFNWINKQVTATFAMLYEAYDRDDKFLQYVLDDGYAKLKLEHVEMIKRYKDENKKESSVHEDSQGCEI